MARQAHQQAEVVGSPVLCLVVEVVDLDLEAPQSEEAGPPHVAAGLEEEAPEGCMAQAQSSPAAVEAASVPTPGS